ARQRRFSKRPTSEDQRHALRPPRARLRTPGRTWRNGRVEGSAITGPGAAATMMRSAMGSKSARKCTEDFSARIGAAAGSTPRWRRIAWSWAWVLRLATITLTPGAKAMRALGPRDA